MEPKLTAPQQALYDAIQRDGSVKRGQGHRITTARALARRGLITLEERRDASGKVHFWRARSTRPAAPKPAPAPVASTATPGGHVLRIAVRNPATSRITWTSVQHLDTTALHAALTDRDVPEVLRDEATGSYGSETRLLEWAPLGDARKEFVSGGELYRLRPSQLGGWEAVMLSTDTVVAAGIDPDEVEQRACADAAAFHHATRN